MTIEAIFLYGSWARGDQGTGSDHDLLMVTSEERSYHVTDGHLSMSYYPLASLESKAAAGDLFVYHIVLEAKVVFDPDNVLGRLRRLLRPKASYAAEVGHGGDLAWFLIHHHQTLPPSLVAKRIAWSVRTVLIARSAMEGRPVFAPDQLAFRSRYARASELIALRHGEFAPPSLSLLRAFLDAETLTDPLGSDASQISWRRHFAASRNVVALQLLKVRDESALSRPYA